MARPVISHARARAIVDRILERTAKDGKKPVAVAVVDDRGDLVAFARQDGVAPRSTRLAADKAYTAALQESATRDFQAALTKAGRTVSAFADPRYVSLPGGVPVLEGSALVGAVGVSGRSADEDHELASDAALA
jgi:uncharacterized protein GlcG (DUF336 family)